MSKFLSKSAFFALLVVLFVLFVIAINNQSRHQSLNADEIVEFVIVSPPFEKKVTQKSDIEEFVLLFNNLKKKKSLSIGNASGWSKRVIVSTGTYEYDIVFSGKNITINHKKYVMESSMDHVLTEYYESLNYQEVNYN